MKKSNRFLFLLLIILFSISALIGCQTKYPVDGKDVLKYIGDGRFQFSRGYDENGNKYVLLDDESTDVLSESHTIEPRVYDYKITSGIGYVVGKKGYTKVDSKTGDIKQSLDINDFNDDDIKQFKKLDSTTK
ncbi:hypothetical protein [Clostridium sp. YIM B02551]|uniref:hypothetical protein n=1 Tax=Clostridium sp. YIM B02551 TaxID=2910679 RepID=UPI001EEBC4C5|nr:hypothetical protein [Clostridium sp. YIM B02551]